MDLAVEQQIQPGVMVQADPDLLQMVIQGLTANAVKFNRDGGLVRFSLTVQNHHAVAAVSNAGTPIPEQERERIFERFYCLDPSRGGHVPGSGLGLSLAREIVRAHEGELRVEVSSENLNTLYQAKRCKRLNKDTERRHRNEDRKKIIHCPGSAEPVDCQCKRR